TTLTLAAGLLYSKTGGEEPPKVADLMRKKLDHSQKDLEGLALNDFEKIARSGEGLILITKKAEGKVVRTPQYEITSSRFRRAAETLIEKSREKNLDGAALAYVDLTLSCVKCHKYFRDTRMTRLDGPSTGGPELPAR